MDFELMGPAFVVFVLFGYFVGGANGALLLCFFGLLVLLIAILAGAWLR